MNPRRTTLVGAAVLVLLVPLASAANDETHLLEEAVASYESAGRAEDRVLRLSEFARAERLFAEAAARAPASPDLLTNLGNAALQAEHLGTAILAYRRALAIEPHHSRAGRNLEQARTRLPAWVPRPAPRAASAGLLDRLGAASDAELGLAAAVAFAIAGATFGAGLAFGLTALRSAALLPAVAWLALLALRFAVASGDAVGAGAVVVATEATARAGDSAFAPSAFAEPLPEGTELRVLEEREGWARVRLSNGRDAWIRSSAIVRVEPRPSTASANDARSTPGESEA